MNRRKSWDRGSPPEWVFEGLKPDGSAKDQNTWTYADENHAVSVGPAPAGKRPSMTKVSVPSPRKRWVDKVEKDKTEEDDPQLNPGSGPKQDRRSSAEEAGPGLTLSS